MYNRGFAFVGHPFTGGGATVVDVRDPRKPVPVNFIATHPRSWSLHFQTFDLLLLAEEFNFIALPAEIAVARSRLRRRPQGLRHRKSRRSAADRLHAGRGAGTASHLVDRRALCLCLGDPRRLHRSYFHRIDLQDPATPREVGRWWVPGMWQAGGETNPIGRAGWRCIIRWSPTESPTAAGVTRDDPPRCFGPGATPSGAAQSDAAIRRLHAHGTAAATARARSSRMRPWPISRSSRRSTSG